MKKLLALFMAAALMIGVVACNKNTADDNSSSNTVGSVSSVGAGNESSSRFRPGTSNQDSSENSSSSVANQSSSGGNQDSSGSPSGEVVTAPLVDSGINYTETLDFVANPGGGFYYDINAGELSDSKSGALVGAEWDPNNNNLPHFDSALEIWDNDYKDEMQSYIHVKFGLKAYSSNMGGTDKAIGDNALKSLRATLENLRTSGMTATVRFAYDSEGVTYKSFNSSTGICDDSEPKDINVVVNHVKQISAVLNDFTDCVYAVDAGLFGPWGEMHSSTFGRDDEKDNINSYYNLTEAWLNNLDENITILLRKPQIYLKWYNKKYNTSYTTDGMSQITSNEYDERIGFFNDGFLTTEDDWGTYSHREEEIKFLARKNASATFGGEVEYVANSTYRLGQNAVKTFEELHVSYLNYFYNQEVIKKNTDNNAWKQVQYGTGMDSADIESNYVGQTYYKYIANRLGYRLVLRESKLSESAKAGGAIRLVGKIENLGFANVTQNKNVYIVLSDGVSNYYVKTNINAKDLKSKQTYEYDLTINLPAALNAGTCKVYMKISGVGEKSETETKRQIAFANMGNVYDAQLGANYLGQFSVSK